MIGIDTVNIARIKKIVEGSAGSIFLQRIFTSEEIRGIPIAGNPARPTSIARLFAAKESLIKASAGTLSLDGLNRIQVSIDGGKTWDVHFPGISSDAQISLSCSVGSGYVIAIAQII